MFVSLAAKRFTRQVATTFKCRTTLLGCQSRVPTTTTIVVQQNPVHLLSTSATTSFEPSPPEQLTSDMAEGIVDATQFFIKYGISNQRLRALADEENCTVTERWQKMMEIYLTTQLHVIGGMGYPANEQGLTQYAQQLAKCIQDADETMRELFVEVRRDTWREIVSTVFKLDPNDIPIISIVDARNLMHKVSSKMIEPDILYEIQQRTSKIPIDNDNPEIEIAKKHQILQDIIVNSVYLGGNPSIVEQAGFGSGPAGYAKFQCTMSDHEGDPLMAQYASHAMMKIMEAAGIDINDITGPGIAKPVP